MRPSTSLLALSMLLAAGGGAVAAPARAPASEARGAADRHFRNGVASFREGKYAEALAEFERAYEISPHPTVLYNIATSLRELSRYRDAVRFYQRFLGEAVGVAPAARLDAARRELDSILARVARVTIKVDPADARLTVDGEEIPAEDMPLILAPGEHRVTVEAAGRQPSSRMVQVASGDDVTVAIALEPTATPAPSGTPDGGATRPEAATPALEVTAAAPARSRRRRFALSAGFETNLRRVEDTGVPSLGAAVALGTRLELAVDALMLGYAVVPAVRVRLFGDRLAVAAVLAAPIVLSDGDSRDPFVAAVAGLGLRLRATGSIALRLEGQVSYAGDHGTTLPAVLGGELWF